MIAISNETLPIVQELQSVRDMVFAGTYNSQLHETICYSKYFDKEINSKSPVKRAKGCGCVNGGGKNCGGIFFRGKTIAVGEINISNTPRYLGEFHFVIT